MNAQEPDLPEPSNPHVLNMLTLRWEDTFEPSFKEAVPDDALRDEIADSIECAIARGAMELSEPVPGSQNRVYATAPTRIAPRVRIYFRVVDGEHRIDLVLADLDTTEGLGS